MKWEEVCEYGIANPGAVDVWNAGHVNDLLITDSDAVLVGTASSGPWLVVPGTMSIALGRDWNNPDVTSLAVDPGGKDHYYASCGALGGLPTSVGSLYETDLRKPSPLLAPWRPVELASGLGSVYRVVIVASGKTRYAVLACDAGVFWAKVPPPGAPHVWTQAIGDAPNGPYSGLAVGPLGTIVAAAWGSDAVGKRYGLFHGSWRVSGKPPHSTLDLVMQRSEVTGVDPKLMFGTSVASCDSRREVMYAASSAQDGTLYAVLRSIDGGLKWTVCSKKMTDAPAGHPEMDLRAACNLQGNFWNNCVGVSPSDPATVVVGWVTASVSQDSGNSWRMMTGTWTLKDGKGGWDARIHTDFHAIRFHPRNPRQLFLTSDGGVMMTPDFGATFQTDYNEKLRNLQFLSTTGIREFIGTTGATSRVPGLVAGGLQDNGNVYAVAPGAMPWKRLDGGDGGQACFLRSGVSLRTSANDPDVRSAHWNAATAELVGGPYLPVLSATGGSIAKSMAAIIEPIRTPGSTNSRGQLMYAVGGRQDEYGAFGNPDGSDLHWEIVAHWPAAKDEFVSAIGAVTGKNIFFATYNKTTSQAFFYLVNSAAGSVAPMPALPVGPSVYVNRVVLQSDSVVYATGNLYVGGASGSGFVLRSSDGATTWKKLEGGGLPDEIFYGIDLDWTATPAALYVATDDRVYTSVDEGATWKSDSDGLPRRPHCADIRFVRNPDGNRILYLGTFGWSVWRKKITS